MLTLCSSPFFNILFFTCKFYNLQLLAMDVLAWTTMKDAANCDKRCEWQNSANQENAERKLRFGVIPQSMSVSGHSYCYAFKSSSCFGRWRFDGAFVCQRREIRCHIKNSSFTLRALPLGVLSSSNSVRCSSYARCNFPLRAVRSLFMHEIR